MALTPRPHDHGHERAAKETLTRGEKESGQHADAVFLRAPHKQRWSLLLMGFAIQLSSVAVTRLVQLYVIHELDHTARDYTREVYGLRYQAIFIGVLLLAPLGSIVSTARALRWMALATAASVAAMAWAPYTPLRFLSAMGSATSSLSMVFVNALIQQASRTSSAVKVRFNMEYRVLSALGGIAFPWIVTNVFVAYFQHAYSAAFLVAAATLLLAATLFDPRFELLATAPTPEEQQDHGQGGQDNRSQERQVVTGEEEKEDEQDKGRKEENEEVEVEGGDAAGAGGSDSSSDVVASIQTRGIEGAIGSEEHTRSSPSIDAGTTGPKKLPRHSDNGSVMDFCVMALRMFVRPFCDVATPRAMVTLLCLLSASAPGVTAGTFSVSRLKDLGASQQLVGTLLAMGKGLGILGLACAPYIVPRLTPPLTIVAVMAVDAVALAGMAHAGTPEYFGAAHALHALVSNFSPVANSMWMSTSIAQESLPSMFAVNKACNTASSALIGHVLAWLLQYYDMQTLFLGSALAYVAGSVGSLVLILWTGAHKQHKLKAA